MGLNGLQGPEGQAGKTPQAHAELLLSCINWAASSAGEQHQFVLNER